MGVSLCRCRRDTEDYTITYAKLSEDVDLCTSSPRTELMKSYHIWQQEPGVFFWKASVKSLQTEMDEHEELHYSILIPVIFSIIYWWDSTYNDFLESYLYMFDCERPRDFIQRMTSNLPSLMFHECHTREMLDRRLDGLLYCFANGILPEEVAQNFFHGNDACFHANLLSFIFDMVDWSVYLDDPKWCGWKYMTEHFLREISDNCNYEFKPMHVFQCMLPKSENDSLACVQYLTFEEKVDVAGTVWVFDRDQVPDTDVQLAQWHDCQLCLASQGALVFHNPLFSRVQSFPEYRKITIRRVARHYMQFLKVCVLKYNSLWPQTILDDICSFITADLMLPISRICGLPKLETSKLYALKELPLSMWEIPNYQLRRQGKERRRKQKPRKTERIRVDVQRSTAI